MSKHPQFELFRTGQLPISHHIKNPTKQVTRDLELNMPMGFTLTFVADRGTEMGKYLMDLAMGRNGAVLVPTYNVEIPTPEENPKP